MFELLAKSKRLVITAHTQPDPDAIGSCLGVYQYCKQYLPEVQTTIVLDGQLQPFAESFGGINEIVWGDFFESIAKLQPDTIIFLDASGFDRFCSDDGDRLAAYCSDNRVAIIGVDHHEEVEGWGGTCEWYYNTKSSSCSEDIASLILQEKKAIPETARLPLLVGMVADTGRFLYPNTHRDQTTKVLTYFDSVFVTVQQAQECLEKTTLTQLKTLSIFLSHLTVNHQHSLSWLEDVEVEELLALIGSVNAFNAAMRMCVKYLAQVDQIGFGYVVYRHPTQHGVYKGSFRSTGVVDCAALASLLGGGGHRGAAGFELKASTLEEVKERVEQVINNRII